MRKAVISLTRRGAILSEKIADEIGADIYMRKPDESFATLMERIFFQYDAIICIMACGIVVRLLASLIKNKREDPAVIVLDEKGEFVISLLSGHVGGANYLTKQIAEKIGATPVITTATDVNGVVAFDLFAQKNNCMIENFEDLRYFSSRLVNGGKVSLFCDFKIEDTLPENIVLYGSNSNLDKDYVVALTEKTDLKFECKKVLFIRPKNLILGIGCKRGTSKRDIKTSIEDFLYSNKKSFLSIKFISTIDQKCDEEGILEFCKENGMKLNIISKEEVEKVQAFYKGSEFVKDTIGVSCVAEPCAVLGGRNANIVCEKTIYRGITLALAKESEYSVKFLSDS